MTYTPEFPPEITARNGLTSYPDRGSDNAGLFQVAWEHARRRVTITYERQDALWCVSEYNADERISADLFPRADHAYAAALDILVSPLP